MIVFLVLLPILVAAAGVAGWWFTREPLGHVLHDRLRSTVLVTLKSGETYQGALFDADAHSVVLRGTESLGSDGSRVSVDGELLILRGDVAYIQRP